MPEVIGTRSWGLKTVACPPFGGRQADRHPELSVYIPLIPRYLEQDAFSRACNPYKEVKIHAYH
jgi:hypothetical protein